LTSRPLEILLSLTRDGTRTLGAQIEDQIRGAVRAGILRPGAPIPSTRDLAHQLRISRPLVVDAYAQLAAEGYLTLRQGARPRVSAFARSRKAAVASPATPLPPPRFDFRPSIPDLSAFPRARWLKAFRDALGKMAADDFGYGDRHGCAVLRLALAEYLGRVRGVVADPEQIVITSGFAQGRGLACRALRATGAKWIAFEDPSYTEWEAVSRVGLEFLPIPVDEGGIRVDELERSKADAVTLTPAHQFPTGVVMTGERRLELLAWLCRRDAIAIEDDYDAEYRYDRAPVGALQGMDPDRVIYAGTVSKTLAPALRMGWLVVPRRLLKAVQSEHALADFGCPRIDQHTLAEFIASGEFDRHLRRMRVRYRERRDVLLATLGTELPEVEIDGIAAGLHATVRLPAGHDEEAIREQARRRGIALEFMSEHFVGRRKGPPTLLLGYGRSAESTIRAGVRALAAAIRAAQVGGLKRSRA
jgi:GntR family transcriptional regulator/MocR family aminotransferase